MRYSSEYTSRKLPNIAKALSTDSSRPILMMGHLDTERGVIEAMDSYGLVCLPVEIEEGDVSGLVPPEALVAFYKAHKQRGPLWSLACGEREIVLEVAGARQSWPRPTDGTFPNIPSLIPEEDNRSGFRICLDPKRLLRLAEALGTETVTLGFTRAPNTTEEGEGAGYFPSNLRPIMVGNGNHGESALLMPIRIP